MKLVGVKEVRKNEKGEIIGCTLKMGDELNDELIARLAKGEELVKVVYNHLPRYLQHLKENGINHRVFKTNDGTKAVMVKIDDNFKRFEGLAGISEIFFKLEGEGLDSAVKTFLKAEIEIDA